MKKSWHTLALQHALEVSNIYYSGFTQGAQTEPVLVSMEDSSFLQSDKASIVHHFGHAHHKVTSELIKNNIAGKSTKYFCVFAITRISAPPTPRRRQSQCGSWCLQKTARHHLWRWAAMNSIPTHAFCLVLLPLWTTPWLITGPHVVILPHNNNYLHAIIINAHNWGGVESGVESEPQFLGQWSALGGDRSPPLDVGGVA